MGRARRRSDWLTLVGVLAALVALEWGPSWLSAIVVVVCAARVCQLGWRALRSRSRARGAADRGDRLG